MQIMACAAVCLYLFCFNVHQYCYRLQTLELRCLQPSLCDLEFELSRYASHRIRTLAASRRLIVEIDGSSMGNTKLASSFTQHSELMTEVRLPFSWFRKYESNFWFNFIHKVCII